MKIISVSFVRLRAIIAILMKPSAMHTTPVIMTPRCVMCSYCCNWHFHQQQHQF